MTPQEINEYKLRWMGSSPYSVRLHSDLADKGKTWARRNLERHQWKFDTWTANYEHTFHFELEEHSLKFVKQFPKFTNQ